ncbi:MAG TPA: sugar ABC transporter permease [Anaerolineaceae bacterium]|jgi:alpha-glucoside transport system permease protein|nr:sugar ABC transporter permease [Anaerolineaceae bacterium]HOE34151.1 sugar ABC transporter permease [Anaerolineaceae bacterium]HOT25148.1 sugar ABC transporter permease [Anaerolineaceae bacterium]HQH57920.1 sugar ABC transporter permease [Anaerolineaceae bacterium]HQK02791.1 sugar ABC transporter permease [Anaerolineaceae bacterium]
MSITQTKSPGANNLITKVLAWFGTTIGQLLISVLVPAITFLVLWQGYLFLQRAAAPQIVQVLVAIVWGVGGVALLYVVTNWLVMKLPRNIAKTLQPFVFVGPAVVIMGWFLAVPVVRSLVASFRNYLGTQWVGLENYKFAFTDPRMLETFRNNLLWLVFGTFFSVAFGLLIATLADRSKAEVFYKSIIFTPYALSFVGAGVIWKFIYTYKGTGVGIREIGLLNAVVTALGGTPQPWLNLTPWNNFFLIVIMIWLQTGYAMVILSSAIKGVPAELLEAARIDGANEFKIFFSIIVPYIKGTLLTVTTTIIIFSLKTFDIVRVMTGGNNGTNVIANEFYLQSFTYNHAGRASAIAIVLLLLVTPVIINNVRSFNQQRRGF